MTIASTLNLNSMQNPLLKGRHTPNLSQAASLNTDDKQILSMRGLNTEQQNNVETIYKNAREAIRNKQGKNFLLNLDTQSLSLLQEAASLATPTNIASLSEEGAENLLLTPSEAIDLNKDGLIETGSAMGFQFPPSDASQELRSAWEKTTATLEEGDTLTLMLTIGGGSITADGTYTKTNNFSDSFDWNTYMKNLLASNESAKSYNTIDQYNKMNNQLNNFWSALQEQGLA